MDLTNIIFCPHISYLTYCPWGEISIPHKLGFSEISPPQSLLPSNAQILNLMLVNLFIIVFILLVTHCVWQNNKIKIKNKINSWTTILRLFARSIRATFTTFGKGRLKLSISPNRKWEDENSQKQFLWMKITWNCWFFVEEKNSERQVKGKLGHVAKIHVCRLP